MSSIKLPYHPEIVSQVHVTRFGVSEITTPLVYETPIKDKIIARVDLLEVLRGDWGDSALHARSTTYSIVSGNCDDDILRQRFASYYRKYVKVMNYVNSVYECGSVDKPLMEQVLEDVRSKLSSYTENISNIMNEVHGKYLVTTHLYTYYAFVNRSNIPKLEGLKLIC